MHTFHSISNMSLFVDLALLYTSACLSHYAAWSFSVTVSVPFLYNSKSMFYLFMVKQVRRKGITFGGDSLCLLSLAFSTL